MAALYVTTYNADLAELRSLARVAWADQDKHPDMLELRNGSGELLALIPVDTEPQVAAIACRLYAAGYVEGREAGKASAWASLRRLIGAAAERPPRSTR